MDTHILFLVLAAALFHALWNASVKSGEDKLLSIAAMNLSIMLIVLPMLPWVGLPHVDALPYLFASMFFHFGYNVGLATAYRYGDFAVVYPLARGCAPVLVTLWGVFVLHEGLAGNEWLALLGVLSGIMIFVTRRLEVVLRERKALFSALLTSVFIAAYTVVDGIGGRLSMNVAGYVVWVMILNSVPIMLYALHQRSAGELLTIARQWRLHFPAAALSLAAYWIVVWAMSQASIPLVAALRETSIIIAALIGAYYFKEPSGKRRIIASIVIFFSIALLGWSESHAIIR